MPKLDIHSLGQKLLEHRGKRGLREVAKEIGVSAATLSRIEGGQIPDLDTFTKLCRWLSVDPGEVLGFKSNNEAPVTVHFKKETTLAPETAQDLAKMVLAAQRALAHLERDRGGY